MKEINVEEIMAEIRQEIKEKGYTPDILSFRDENASFVTVHEFSSKDFMNTVGHLEMTKYVPWKQDNIGSGAKGMVKKAVRKVIGPIIAPVSDKQNVYNNQVTDAFGQLLGFIEMQSKAIEELERKVEALQEDMKKLEKK